MVKYGTWLMVQDPWKTRFADLAADGVLREGSIDSMDYRNCFYSSPGSLYANFYQVAMGNLSL